MWCACVLSPVLFSLLCSVYFAFLFHSWLCAAVIAISVVRVLFGFTFVTLWIRLFDVYLWSCFSMACLHTWLFNLYVYVCIMLWCSFWIESTFFIFEHLVATIYFSFGLCNVVHVCKCVYQCECKLQHMQTMIINMIMNCVRIRSAKLHSSMTNVWDDSRGSRVLAEDIGWSRAVTQWCRRNRLIQSSNSMVHVGTYPTLLSRTQHMPSAPMYWSCTQHTLPCAMCHWAKQGSLNNTSTMNAMQVHTCTYHGCVLCTGMAARASVQKAVDPKHFQPQA
jgi:hypothetical protein